MKVLKVTTRNNVYYVEEDDAGKLTCRRSTHPDKRLMGYFIDQPVTHLKAGDMMLVDGAHTSTVMEINEAESLPKD